MGPSTSQLRTSMNKLFEKSDSENEPSVTKNSPKISKKAAITTEQLFAKSVSEQDRTTSPKSSISPKSLETPKSTTVTIGPLVGQLDVDKISKSGEALPRPEDSENKSVPEIKRGMRDNK